MSSVRERFNRILGAGEGTDRLAFFSDAVFAIAMTLLVIDLKVPDGEPGEELSAWVIVTDQLPAFFAYTLSFIIIGINWVAHHRKFRVIVRWDPRLIQLNFVLLFLITFVPFPTALIAETPAEFISVTLYATVVGGLSLAQFGIWMYARRAGLMSDQVDERLFRYVAYSTFPVPIVFFGSILIAIFSPLWAMLSWILLAPISIVTGIVRRRAASVESGSVEVE